MIAVLHNAAMSESTEMYARSHEQSLKVFLCREDNMGSNTDTDSSVVWW